MIKLSVILVSLRVKNDEEKGLRGHDLTPARRTTASDPGSKQSFPEDDADRLRMPPRRNHRKAALPFERLPPAAIVAVV